MITYIDKSQAENYSTLVEAAGIIGVDVDKLDTETYIANLDKLANATNGTKYVRLPIDEDVFEVDANARTITVPKNSFAKNGVGVVGDELAEIIYFRMARFFDIADLASNDMQIYIQWENAEGKQGVSLAYAKDMFSDPEKVYFGWALSSAITAKAGNIKFNIRVVKRGKVIENGVEVPAILYSFSTQTATVAIKAALNLDLLADDLYVDYANDAIAERLLGNKMASFAKIAEGGNLPASAVKGAELKLTLDEGTIDEDSIVTYRWYKDGDLYLRDKEGHDVAYYAPALTVTETGDYYVVVLVTSKIVDTKAKNTAGEEIDLEYHTSTATTRSSVCSVPSPVKLEILTDIADKLIIGDHAVLRLEVSKQALATVGCRVLKSASAAKVEDPSALEIATVADDASVDVNLEGESAVITVTPQSAGYYKLVAVNSLNGSNVESDASAICRVTEAPRALEVKVTKNEGVNKTSNAVIGDHLHAVVAMEGVSAENSDEIKYQWCKKTLSIDNDDERITGAINKDFTPEAEGAYYVVVTNILNGESVESESETVTVQL